MAPGESGWDKEGWTESSWRRLVGNQPGAPAQPGSIQSRKIQTEFMLG